MRTTTGWAFDLLGHASAYQHGSVHHWGGSCLPSPHRGETIVMWAGLVPSLFASGFIQIVTEF